MKIRRVDFSPDEFLAGTTELSLEETGGYWKACSLMYSRGGPIADDEAWLAKVCGAHVRTWRKVRARLLELGKLRVVDIEGRPHLTNTRTEAEILRAAGRINQAAEATAESVRKRREKADSASTQPRQEVDSASTDGPKVTDKTGELFNSNDLGETSAPGHGRANHQPPTTNSKNIDTESLTNDAPAEAGTRRKAEPRGAKIPDDWEPGEDLKAWTRDAIAEAGAGDWIKPGKVIEEFRDYWKAIPGRQGRKSDWPATWKNRIRALIERGARPNGSSSTGQKPHHTSIGRKAAFGAALSGLSDSEPDTEGGGN